ncbi:feruloyl CoA ortho-hydroxylase F6H1-3-like [Gastrolobium bilobum]|uniref:feruloyl CoA ortho-hydroxylase F6H1-3-like n=1 Tax=Gastrolobium bilobum TaxID=150636 RepID=UPI002AAF6238|nr:feruloyl CoA ortho-hydroxylase F6H1-3-like [Gastrolobium bilobum]
MAPTVETLMTIPSDLNEFVMLQGNGVKGLYEIGLKSLPKQYIQPLEERMSMAKIVTQNSIPIVDMSNWDDPNVANAICDAAEKWGFFQIINHGVPLQVLDNVQNATYRFYDLPAEEKVKYTKENSPSNHVRYGSSFSPEAENALEWKDYLSLFYVSEDEAAATWPQALRDEALEFMKKSETIIKQLLSVLMKRLNVMEIDETNESMLMGSKRINFNYYPICPNQDLTVAIGRHSDVSTLTVLLQDQTGGLYVRAEDRHSWIHVPPISGALVINIGDALQIMSNGRYKSIEHRAAANGSKTRVSVPIFVNPRPSDVIGPLPQVLASGEKATYKNVLYSDYVKHFFRKAHDGKMTIDYAKIF